MLDWFTTIPGLSIACGVIILIIAIVLFVLDVKKSQKEVTSVNNLNENNNVNLVDQPLETNITNTNEQSVQSVNAVKEPVMQTANAIQNIVVPVVDEVQPTAEAIMNPTVDNMVAAQQIEETETPVINIPIMENVQPEVNIDPVIESVSPTITNSIYGGEVPTYSFEQPVEKTVTIYGGNDPMEATQTLPKVEVNHVPYGGYSDVKVIEPTVDEVLSIPESQPVVEEIISTVAPVVEETPVVIPTTIVADVEQTPVINIPDMEDDVEEL